MRSQGQVVPNSRSPAVSNRLGFSTATAGLRGARDVAIAWVEAIAPVGHLTSACAVIGKTERGGMEYYGASQPFIAANLRTHRRVRIYLILKRCVERVLALAFLILLTPLFLLFATLIRLDSSGSVLFRQTRVGKDGKPFTCYKFRSLYADVDRSAHLAFLKAFVDQDITEAADDQAVFKPIRPDQVTAVGRFLRKTSLDEVPQLINILKGDMSFVGPRPNMPGEVEEYKDWQKRRLEVLPGITGLAQINGRSSIPFDRIARYDIEYVENESLVLDLRIIVQTVPLVLRGKGAK